MTAPFGLQSRVAPDQRRGLAALNQCYSVGDEVVLDVSYPQFGKSNAMTQHRNHITSPKTDVARSETKKTYQDLIHTPFASPAIWLLRIALAIVYTYLVTISHMMMGIIGAFLISILFLVAFFTPRLYRSTAARHAKQSEGE